MADSVQLRRDPFGRRTLMRDTAGAGECSCCGQWKRTRFTYRWDADTVSGRRGTPSPIFCGVDCAEASGAV